MEEEIFGLTPWGCLSVVLGDYRIDTSDISGTVGNHIVEDFMNLMIANGHIAMNDESLDKPTKA